MRHTGSQTEQIPSGSSWEPVAVEAAAYARKVVPYALEGDFVAQMAVWACIRDLSAYGSESFAPGLSGVRLGPDGRMDARSRMLVQGYVREMVARARLGSDALWAEMGRPAPEIPDIDLGESRDADVRCSVEIDVYGGEPRVALATDAGTVWAAPYHDPDLGAGIGTTLRGADDEAGYERSLMSLTEYVRDLGVVRTVVWDETHSATEVVNLELTQPPRGLRDRRPDPRPNEDGIPACVADWIEEHGRYWVCEEEHGPYVEVELPYPTDGADIVVFDFRGKERQLGTVAGWAAEAKEVLEAWDADYEYRVNVDDLGRPPAMFASGAEFMEELCEYRDHTLTDFCKGIVHMDERLRKQTRGRRRS